jgi:DNA-binding NtrC family response regulator
MIVNLCGVLGDSPAIDRVRRSVATLLERGGHGRLPPILIHGETGTGKGLLARELVAASPRAAGPFVVVNCAAIPATLLESELFGYERGSFTGACESKQGLFQSANRGTLFLDELTFLPRALQAKLLVALEDRAVRRLGSMRAEPLDAWIISATSSDVAESLRKQELLDALYHRLSVLELELPPLRARGKDVVLLARRFLEDACAEYGLAPKSFSAEALAALEASPWPGNVRQLRNVIERVALLYADPVVTEAALDLKPLAGPERTTPVQLLENFERTQILDALERTRWNLARAAELLGLPRNTLRYRMTRRGLRRPPELVPARHPSPSPATRALRPSES